MIVRGTVTYAEVLTALGVESLPLEWEARDEIVFENVDVDDDALPEPECLICGGVEPEPEPGVDARLIGDVIEAVGRGDTSTAQALVHRAFDDKDDAAIAERAICRCAA